MLVQVQVVAIDRAAKRVTTRDASGAEAQVWRMSEAALCVSLVCPEQVALEPPHCLGC